MLIAFSSTTKVICIIIKAVYGYMTETIVLCVDSSELLLAS